MPDAVRKRFGEPAELITELEDLRAAETQQRLRRLLTLTGEERALDVGTGAFAIALAPFVREVVGVDVVPELLEEGRKRAPANVELVGADSNALPYERGSFDLACTAGTLHHIQRPDDILLPITDRVPVPRPFHTVLSAGDVISMAGAAWVVAGATLPAGRRRRVQRREPGEVVEPMAAAD